MRKIEIWKTLKGNKKKIWNLIRIVYWTFIFIVALTSMILIYSEFLSA